ncbi:hypothetical protein H4CHR_02915 [Variovorax sp. PBS-H4]|uniref:DUF7227 family protein n=1 Tax=Variovorax sp. PBS-H4 TaxID=434008 RepID=UPI0013192627|nr:hypothetical protein [Variovorax sp. PBS-H4]VTU31969.1 hypothetical protein H4CHR_02915 [Variovorax sp. PBS-H4]
MQALKEPARKAPRSPAAKPVPVTYHFTRVSSNQKTGPIPVTTTSSNSCPPTCSFKSNGCYAEHGPLAIHWRQLDAGKRGYSFDELIEDVLTIRRNALWRHNQAGDLTPSAPGEIDGQLLTRLAIANKGKRGFTYTHYQPTPHNRAAIRTANLMGFTVNLSAETLEQADEYAEIGIAPVVVVLPADATKAVKTPAGRHVIVCPATTGNTDCLNCGICQKQDRTAIVGFPAHGSGAKRAQAVFFMKKE